MSTAAIKAMCRSAVRISLATAFILMLPLLMMRFTGEAAWSPADFAAAGALLTGAGLAYELAAGRSGSTAYRAAAGVAVAATLILVWLNLAVGLIGAEDNPANLMCAGVLAVEMVGARIARLRPHGMALALAATALAQILVGVTALIFGLGHPENGPLEIVLPNGFFAALFTGSAWLFWHAAHEKPEPEGG